MRAQLACGSQKNPSSNVLACLVCEALTGSPDASPTTLQDRVLVKMFQHGWLADHWVAASSVALTAGLLALQPRPVV